MRFSSFFFVKISSWVEFSNLLFFVVFWTRRPLDPSRFRRGQAIFCYIHSHGWSISGCPIIFLSSGIERRARAPSFPLLRISIGSWQLPQRAARSARSWWKYSKLPYEQILWFTGIRSTVSRKTCASIGMRSKLSECSCRVSSRQLYLNRHVVVHRYSLVWLSNDPCLSSTPKIRRPSIQHIMVADIQTLVGSES